MANKIAQQLDGELNVILMCKLGAPSSSEYALGAADETGLVYESVHAGEALASTSYLKEEKLRQLAVLQKRRM